MSESEKGIDSYLKAGKYTIKFGLPKLYVFWFWRTNR